MKPIVVVGSINADLVTRSHQLPGPGETVAGESFEVFAGGKGANQAVGVARLGHDSRLIGRVGSDSFGRDLRTGLEGYGVDISGVGEVDGTSGVAVIQVEGSGENRITVVAGANAALTPEYLEAYRSQVAGAAMVLTQLETPMATVEALGRLCVESGVPLMLDPAPAAPLGDELLRQVTWLTPNLHEARVLAGAGKNGDPAAMAQALRARGARNVLVKLGEDGAVTALEDGSLVRVDAFAVEAWDTTAAGDASNAGLAVGLARGMRVDEAMQFASAVAALSVRKAGAQPSMPGLEEVEEFLRERRAQAAIPGEGEL